jgi:hypothetical protein
MTHKELGNISNLVYRFSDILINLNFMRYYYHKKVLLQILRLQDKREKDE